MSIIRSRLGGDNRNTLLTSVALPSAPGLNPNIYAGVIDQPAAGTAPSTAPIWQVDWKRDTALPGQLAFSRASSATYFNSSGYRVSAANDVPRWEYNPATGAPQGLLGEEQRTNTAWPSSGFSGWTDDRTSISTDGTLSLDNTLATKVTASVGTNTYHEVYKLFAGDSGLTYSCSFEVKAGTSRYIYVSQQSGVVNNWIGAVFDIGGTADASATQTAVGTTAGTIVSATSKYLRDGWFRLTLVGSLSGTQLFPVVGIASAATGNDLSTGDCKIASTDGTETIYVGSAQLELGACATSQIVTTSAAATRSADILSSTDAGLLAAQGWVIETGEMVAATAATILGINTGIALGVTTGNALTTDDGGAQTTTDTGTWTGQNRAAIAWDSAPRVSIVLNGGTVVTAGNTSVTPTALYFGNTNNGASGFLNGHIRSMAAYSALTDTHLDTLSTVGSSFFLYGGAALNLDAGSGSFASTGYSALIDVSMATASGAYALTGNTASMSVALTASSGGFSLTGFAVGDAVGEPASSGSFAFTGYAAGLKAGLPASSGSFALTGYSATLIHMGKLAAASGSFALTGNSAGLNVGLPASSGAFALTGYAAGDGVGEPAGSGAFALTVYAAALIAVRKLAAASGSFAFTGYSTTLKVGLPASSGAFNLTGFSAGDAIREPAGSGTFALTGRSAANAVGMPASSGTFALTGYAASLVYSGAARNLAALSGSFVLTGYNASSNVGLPVSSGSFALTGYSTGDGVGEPATSSAFSLTGYAATFVAVRKLPAGSGAFSLAGQPAVLAPQVTASSGTFTLAGGTLSFAVNEPLGSGTFALTGHHTIVVLPLAGDPISETAIVSASLQMFRRKYPLSAQPKNTARSLEVPFDALIRREEPDFARERRRQPEYDFTNHTFEADPSNRGAYEAH